ncbi:MAG: NAD(P)H-binding protein, partial [Rhodospirillaceae bacterium]|nr:NAD(P)H-binding protein [Rhodospirillaceae bacterium]
MFACRLLCLLFVLPLAAPALAQSPPLVVVAGASGETGLEVVKALRAKNFTVRGLTRDPTRVATQYGDLAEWVAADARDPATLKPAFAGAAYGVST